MEINILKTNLKTRPKTFPYIAVHSQSRSLNPISLLKMRTFQPSTEDFTQFPELKQTGDTHSSSKIQANNLSSNLNFLQASLIIKDLQNGDTENNLSPGWIILTKDENNQTKMQTWNQEPYIPKYKSSPETSPREIWKTMISRWYQDKKMYQELYGERIFYQYYGIPCYEYDEDVHTETEDIEETEEWYSSDES